MPDYSRTHWHFIVNPAAGGGAAGRKWQALFPTLRAQLIEPTFSISTERQPLDELAERAVHDERLNIVGVGGDGTHHQILQGLVRSGRLAEVTYAPLAAGSGNDWVRTLRTPRDLDRWVRYLQARNTLQHTVGKLEYNLVADHHARGSSYFLNVAGMAYDAEVVRRSATARFRSPITYPLYTLGYLLSFLPPVLRVRYAGGDIEGPLHTVNLGLGRYSGGGMTLVPHADPRRGDFALTVADAMGVAKILANSWRFYTGSIHRVNGVRTRWADRVEVSGTTGLEADGEFLGWGPVVATIHPERLRVVVR